MVQIFITDRTGQEQVIEAREGRLLMEAIRESGYDELSALCGGCCSCATCHVYLDAEHLEGLPLVSDDENDLLDSSDHRKPESRLSCQVPVTAALNGLRVTISPE